MHQFRNDLFEMMYRSFDKLFPNHKECYVQWCTQDELDEIEACGDCEWHDDGSIWVYVSTGLTVEHALDTLAHELAHVAVGFEHQHDDMFKLAYNFIQVGFAVILEETFET